MIFYSKVQMGDDSDKHLNFVFNEENHKQKSWEFFGHTCDRSLLVFMCQFFVVVLIIIACAIVRIRFSTTCEETTLWVSTLSSTVG